MKKALLLLATYCLLLTVAFAQELKLKDVPDDHWAASAVYDLVKLGVTRGYPDGTFRGGKPITRYETAIFLSKLSKAIGGDDLKAEIAALRDQLVEIKNAPKQEIKLVGHYKGDFKEGGVLAAPGPAAEKAGAANYRLVLSAKKELAENADMKINFDTMDFGYFADGTAYFPGKGQLASELLDIESNLKLDSVNLKLTYGPGPKQHFADPTNAFPSEVGVVYVRPKSGIEAATKLFGADVSGAYYSAQGQTLDTSGRVNNSWLTGTISYTLEKFLLLNAFKVGVTGDYVSQGLFSAADRSVKAKVEFSAPLGDKAEASTTVAVGRTPSKMMVKGAFSLKDPLETGTVITVRAAKVGAEYIDTRFYGEQIELAGFDSFSRPLENGTVNLGGELTQYVSDRTRLIGKGDIRLGGDYKYSGDKARLTAQGGIEYNIAPNVNFDAAYRVHQDKATGDTSDLAAVGLMYKF